MTAELLDVVIPVRPGDQNEELRYALRSIAANLPHHVVWLAGHRPSWVTGIGHVPVAQDRDRWTNVLALIAATFRPGITTDAVVLMNDDFYVMRPVTELPIQNLGPLLGRHRAIQRPPKTRIFMEGLLATDAWLRGQGITDPLSYELHTPLVVDRDGYAEAARIAAHDVGHLAAKPRSIYGNLARLGGETVDDVKIANATTRPPADALFVSSDDVAFDVGLVGATVRAAFPTPCRYELQTAPA